MEQGKKLSIFRWVFFALGLLFVGIALSLLLAYIGEIVEGEKSLFFSFKSLFSPIIFFVLGWLFISLAISIKNVFKRLTDFSISLGVILILLGIFLLSFNSHSTDIGESIQPSLDYAVAATIDQAIENKIPIDEGKEISVVLPKEFGDKKTYYVENLTESQANVFASEMGYGQDSKDDKILRTKILISSIYEQFSSKSPESLEEYISLNEVSKMLKQRDQYEQAISTNPSLLSSLYDINESAYLNVVVGGEVEQRNITLGNLEKEETEKIWKSLGFASNVSYRTKEKFVNFFFSQINNMENVKIPSPVPISTVSTLMPSYIKEFSKYDLFSENLSLRADELNRFRESCKDRNNITNGSVCNVVVLTGYENMVDKLSSNISTNMSNATLAELPSQNIKENWGTTDKVGERVGNITSVGIYFILGGILLMIISSITYYLHFRLFKRELVGVHIPYYIAKRNTISVIPPLIFTGIVVWLFKSNFLFDYLFKELSFNDINMSKIIGSLPIIEVLIDILEESFIILTGYFIVALVAFFILRKMLKNSLDREQETPE